MAKEVHSKFLRGAEGGKASHDALPSSASIFSELTGLPIDAASSTAIQADRTSSSKSLPDTNIGFRLLKKSGWKEGSGLGVLEQGRLDPLETQFKSDRRGIGAEKKLKQRARDPPRQEPTAEVDLRATKRAKKLSKKAKKMKAEEEQMQERAFEQEFYREFWPENV